MHNVVEKKRRKAGKEMHLNLMSSRKIFSSSFLILYVALRFSLALFLMLKIMVHAK